MKCNNVKLNCVLKLGIKLVFAMLESKICGDISMMGHLSTKQIDICDNDIQTQ